MRERADFYYSLIGPTTKSEDRRSKIETRRANLPADLFHRFFSIIGLRTSIFALIGSASALANPAFTITGGADVSGHNYSWQVRNSGAQPIVEVRFPRFPTGLFFPPSGWSSDCTAPVQVGTKGVPDVCTTRAISSGDAISPGRSLAFSMRITSGGVRRGPGEVTVRFSDGSETRVAGVELPQPEAAGDKNLPLFGLGGVFVIFVIAQAVRKRRRRAMRADEGRAAETESR